MKKKFAIYVEGQTEQILLSHLFKTWWNFTGIRIENIKLFRNVRKDLIIPNFPADSDYRQDADFLFLIIDIQGVGALQSIITERAKRQHDQGFEIIALRDLHAQDFEDYRTKEKRNFQTSESIQNIAKVIEANIKKAFKQLNCGDPNIVDLHFAIMDIEAWLLTFRTTLSKWAGISEEKVKALISNDLTNMENLNSEFIKNPNKIICQISELGGKSYSKSFHTAQSLVSHISREEINTVYQSSRNSSFSKFWNKFSCLA